MRRYLLSLAIVVSLFIAGYIMTHLHRSIYGVTSRCQAINGLPDVRCTPGGIATISLGDICVPGYAKTARNVPQSRKNQVKVMYNASTWCIGAACEVDHLISLELGGSNDVKNLWPEAATPTPGFHEKDRVENWLHDQVCTGKILLKDAQKGIAKDWKQYLSKMH